MAGEQQCPALVFRFIKSRQFWMYGNQCKENYERAKRPDAPLPMLLISYLTARC